MAATRSEATRSGCVLQAGLLFCWRCEAISPKALPQGPVSGAGPPGHGSAGTRARTRSVSDAFPEAGRIVAAFAASDAAGSLALFESELKGLLSWQSCGACGREARECGQRGGRRPCVVHGLSTRPAGRGPARRARPQIHRTLADRCRMTVRPAAACGPHVPAPPPSARIDEPCSSKRIAPWTRRSRMASATVGSATV